MYYPTYSGCGGLDFYWNQSGHQGDVINLDLPLQQKVFDRVPHARLISKVSGSYRVNGKLLQWIEDFLSNRRQRVCLRGSFSDCVGTHFISFLCQ